MRERGRGRAVNWTVRALAVAYAAPLAVLGLRAAAQVWRAPALWPQRLGMRGARQILEPGIGSAVGNSLVVAVATTALAVVLGWGAARVIGGRDGAARRALYLLVALPLLVPPYAVGSGLAPWFLRLGMADSRTALVLAHLVYVLPYVVLLLAAGFGRRLRELEDAAAVLGVGKWTCLRHVTLPVVAPALAVAALLGLLVSWSQYGTSLAVGGGLPMLPLVLVPFVQRDLQVASALSLLFLVPPLVAVGLAVRLGRTR